MVAAYLYLNAALYLVFAAWMTFSPWKTAATVGYESLSASGRSEFLVIYGGLQLGLAALFAFTAVVPAHRRFGLVVALCLYLPIVLYRIVTVARFWPVKSTTLVVGALEVGLLVAAVALYMIERR